MSSDKKSEPREQVHLRIPKSLKKQFEASLATRPNVSLNDVMNDALAKYFDPGEAEKREAGLIRRLDSLDRRILGLNRSVEITAETVALLTRTLLTLIPQLPKDQETAARQAGGVRYKNFLAMLSEILGSGGKFIPEIERVFGAGEFEQLPGKSTEGGKDGE